MIFDLILFKSPNPSDMDILTEPIKTILEFGATGVLMLWVRSLQLDVKSFKKDLHKSNEDHKNDLRKNADELKSLIQNMDK